LNDSKRWLGNHGRTDFTKSNPREKTDHLGTSFVRPVAIAQCIYSLVGQVAGNCEKGRGKVGGGLMFSGGPQSVGEIAYPECTEYVAESNRETVKQEVI
jgi:hypothetical protein